MSAHLREAWASLHKTGKDIIPPAPGQSPLPSGTYRMYHATSAANLESVKRNGLLLDQARGQTYGEPDAIWFSNRTDYWNGGHGVPGKILVEVAIPREKVDNNFLIIGSPNGNMAVNFDIPPSWIIAIHENWHGSYRWLDDPQSRQRVLDGFYDNIGPDTPDEFRAIQLIKAEGRKVAGHGGFLDTLPIKDDPNLGNEATVRGDGFIRIGPKFHQLSEAMQRNVLWHEAAHLYKLDDAWLNANMAGDWNLAGKMKHGHLNGQMTPGEIVAEAYSVLMVEGARDLDAYSYEGFAEEIAGLARSRGLPT